MFRPGGRWHRATPPSPTAQNLSAISAVETAATMDLVGFHQRFRHTHEAQYVGLHV